MLKKFVLFAAVLLMFSCTDQGVIVKTEFASTQDVVPDTPVFLGAEKVGEVVDVTKTQYGSEITMEIAQEKAAKIHNKAAVVVNRLREGVPLEIHNPPSAITQSIENGQNIEGLDSMLQLVAWGLGSTLDAGMTELTRFQKYLESDEFQRDKASVGVAVDRGLIIAKQNLQHAESELRSTIEKLDLSEAQLKDSIATLGHELSPLLEELAYSGGELMAELDSFASTLEEGSRSKQADGAQLLSQLAEAIDQLSKSMERGYSSGVTSDADEQESKHGLREE